MEFEMCGRKSINKEYLNRNKHIKNPLLSYYIATQQLNEIN